MDILICTLLSADMGVVLLWQLLGVWLLVMKTVNALGHEFRRWLAGVPFNLLLFIS